MDYEGLVIGFFVDVYRVMSCLRDYFIRIYCWFKMGLFFRFFDSKYILFGGFF